MEFSSGLLNALLIIFVVSLIVYRKLFSQPAK